METWIHFVRLVRNNPSFRVRQEELIWFLEDNLGQVFRNDLLPQSIEVLASISQGEVSCQPNGEFKVGCHDKVVKCLVIISLAFAESNVQNLIGKPVFCFTNYKFCKLFHRFFCFSTKLCRLLTRSTNEFIPINDDNLFIIEAKFLLKEINCELTGQFPCLIGFIYSVYHHFAANYVVLSFQN